MAYLVLQEISKRFGSVQALSRVTLEVERGAVHAIVGENGAGKSTLMKILYGLEQPDSGQILLDGRRLTIASPRDAMRHGIGMVHQKFQLIPSFTVVENIVLGDEPARAGWLDRKAARRQVAELLERYGLELDPDRPVRDLSVGERQRVEIAKLLYRQAEVLIFDEATAALTPEEAEGLFRILEQFVAGGKTILYITHKFSEVFRLARHVTVLRRGRVVSSMPVAEATPERLARDIVGAGGLPDLGGPAPSSAPGLGPSTSPDPGPVILDCQGLWVVRPDGVPALRGVDLAVRGGEIVGVAGVEGNGQAELAAAVVGLTPVQAGSIRLDGVPVDGASVKERRRRGIGWIPPDRYTLGSALASSLWDNLIAGEVDLPPFSAFGVLRMQAIRRHARQRMETFDVRAPGPEVPAGSLSGGNLQKVIVAREVRDGLRLLVASNPTSGLDIRATAFVREQLLHLRNRGVAVLLISTDLDEVLQLSDRVLVLHRGEVVAQFPRGAATRETVGRAMAGSHEPLAEVSSRG
ncbi:MAG: ABC transporter ATP-binding protein [Bacillota bacterium]|nr:MAG: heme ABC transporter ATP-binding protein [Bacillota bacterium]